VRIVVLQVTYLPCGEYVRWFSFHVRIGGVKGVCFITLMQARHMTHDVELGLHERESGGLSEDISEVVFARDETHD
jgi:hypothetical protein